MYSAIPLQLEPIGKHGLATIGVAVVEQNIKQSQEVYVPAGKDFLELCLRVRLSLSTSFELHALLTQLDFFLAEIKGTADLGDIGKEQEAQQSDRKRDDRIDDEEPLPSMVAISAIKTDHCRHEVA